MVLSRQDARWVALGPAEDLDREIREYQQAVRGHAVLSKSLRGLHQTLWAPLEPCLPPGTESVLLCPEGQLNFVSFATLLTPEDRFLAESYTLLYLTSGRDLLEKASVVPGREAVMVGDPDFKARLGIGSPSSSPMLRSLEERDLTRFGFSPLPGTARECSALKGLMEELGWKVHPLSGAQATEARVQALCSPGLLHVATHGFFLPSLEIGSGAQAPEARVRLVNPMHRSGLALAGAQTTVSSWKRGETPPPGNDGILTAERSAE